MELGKMQKWEVLTWKIGGEEYVHSFTDLSDSRTDFLQTAFVKACSIESAHLCDRIFTDKKNWIHITANLTLCCQTTYKDVTQ